jgi:hypothetical protein
VGREEQQGSGEAMRKGATTTREATKEGRKKLRVKRGEIKRGGRTREGGRRGGNGWNVGMEDDGKGDK